MHAVLQEAFSAYSLPLTVLLGIIGLYWLVALFGVMDFDALDGALGLDHHDASAADLPGGEGDPGHHAGEGGPLHGMLKLLGAADAPLMFVLTVFSLALWGANVLGNIYLNSGGSGGVAGLVFAGALLAAFAATRLAIRPLRPLMRLLRDTEKRAPIAGLTGRVRSLSVTSESGQVEVVRDGAPILLHARVSEGAPPLPRGAEILVVMQDEASGNYLVRPLHSPGDDPGLPSPPAS